MLSERQGKRKGGEVVPFGPPCFPGKSQPPRGFKHPHPTIPVPSTGRAQRVARARVCCAGVRGSPAWRDLLRLASLAGQPPLRFFGPWQPELEYFSCPVANQNI